MAYAIISPADLVEKFQYALDNHWGYIYGTAGVLWTQAKQNAVTNEQAIKYGKKWIGHYVADCSGLFRWAFNQLGSYMYHGSNTMWNKYCQEQGELVDGQRQDGKELKPGTAVFVHKTNPENRSHVGLYIGNGTVIEAASTSSGVITSKITNKKWTEWGELKYVDYGGSVPESSTKRLLRSGCKGDDVKELQKALNDAGYDCGKVDGIFGTNTRNALVAFQTASGVNPDGICGPQTWAALANSNAATYTVTIEGVTWGQYMKIRELCPLAEAKKER